MYWQKDIPHVRLGLYLILAGVVLSCIGLFARDYHVFVHSPQGYLTGVSYPLYPLGVVLIIISVVLFTGGFYLILKEKITS